MPVSLEIIPIPLGSQWLRTIGNSDPDDLNDFRVRFVFSGNATGLTEAGITLSPGAFLFSLEGINSVWEGVIRPPQAAGMVTVTVNQNAVAEGNPQTSKDIRVSGGFPDVDAETTTQLFAHSYSNAVGIAVSPTHIILSEGETYRTQTGANLYFLDHAGTQQSQVAMPNSRAGYIDYFNDGLILHSTDPSYRYYFQIPDLISRNIQNVFSSFGIITHTSRGLLTNNRQYNRLQTFREQGRALQLLPYGSIGTSEAVSISFDDDSFSFWTATRQGELIYLMNPSFIPNVTFVNNPETTALFFLSELTDDNTLRSYGRLNISVSNRNYDCAVYRDTLYILRADSVDTIDIRKYRPMSLNTKTRIDVQLIDEGGRLDLKQFAPDAEKFTFAVGYKKLPYLSINSSNELAVASNAVTSTSPAFVKLTGINRIDSQDFSFYLVVRQAENPVWRDVDELTMRVGSRYDLFQLVDAESIEFRSGRTQPTGSSLSNGVFTVGTEGGAAHFTARKGSRSSHIEIEVVVIQARDRSNFSDIFRHRVEIAGIDVSADVSVFPTVSATLDAVTLNDYQPNEVVLTLKSNNTNNYKYNEGVANNFWQSNNLKPAGFKEHIKVCVESLVDGRYVSHLLFSGTILKAVALVNDAGVQLTCIDESISMQETLVEGFGTLEKWDTLRRQSDETDFEGMYVPEDSLLPMQIAGSQAWNDHLKMIIRRLALPCEGRAIPNTGHLTPTQFLASGGYLETNPLLKFKAEHRSEDVRFLINQLALNKVVYNVEIDVPAVELDDPFILNRGSVAFSVERTRNTRILTDWVYDATNERILILLSNPEAHIADLLVQYNLNSDAYRVLYAFDKDVVAHRIERRNSTNYYILTSKPIPQDRSASRLPRQTDAVGYAYDSAAEGSEIKIWHFNASSGTLTEHVAEDDNRQPQLGIHYWVGFENRLYIDEFEGIVPSYRGVFKWHSNNLYYRYATSSEFGVARVNTSGTTSEMIDQTTLNYHNHLNFAFDITTSGTIYFVYATGSQYFSTLTIKRRASGGTETTILESTKFLGDLRDADGIGGAYLGAHEALFHNNYLYILAPIQLLDLGEDAQQAASPTFRITAEDTGMSGERSVTTSTALNGVSTITPGDDIPIRIDFNGSVSGATQSDLTVTGGTITAFAISSDMIDVTIRPGDPRYHKNIIIDLAQNAVTQRNEATRIILDFGTRRSRQKSSGAVLYRCNVTAATPSLEVLEKYDFVQLGACNLVVHDNAVHLVEHPPAAAKFKPINPDLDGYWTDDERTRTMGYNLVPEPLGGLKRINPVGESESLGNLWFEERPSNVAATRCLSFDGDLHVSMAYGNLDEILRVNSLASKPDNVQHLVYGKKLHYVLPKLNTNNNRYALLADIAKKINATLSFENGLIVVRDRNPYRAKTDGNTGTGTANLDFDGQNKAFPFAGYLLIGKEILKFTGIRSGTFTGLQRGILATEVTNHADNTPILYLDEVLESDRISGRLTFSTDTTRIYNVIRNSDNTSEEADTTSVTIYGELPYTLNLGLTKHELAWQAYILKNYLEHLKEPQQLINLTLKPTNYLEIGQIIGVKYGILVYAVQILSITKNKQSTQIRGRTL